MRAWAWLFVAACTFRHGVLGIGGQADDAALLDTADSAAPDVSTLQQGLIAWYEMESINASEALDSTGHGHTGTCSACPVVVAGHLGNGFAFDGTNRVDIGDGGAFDTTAFTIAAWVEYTSLSYSAYECPVGKVLDSTNYNSWELCYDGATGKWLYETVPPGPTFQFAPLEATTGPAIDTWYHTAMVWDGTTKTLYVDGAKVASAAGDVAFTAGQPLSFGADIDYGGQSSELVGAMDDLRIYGRALDPGEVAALAAR